MSNEEPGASGERLVGVLLQIAPVVLGIPLYIAALNASQNMLVYFFPGLFMLVVGLFVALIGCLSSPPGFVRAQARGSLLFHGIVAAIAVVVFPLLFAAFLTGTMSAASTLVLLFGTILSVVEIGRALICAISVARAPLAG